MRFLLSALESGQPPERLGLKDGWAELTQARAFLEFEYQTYLESLGFADLLQLRIPMTDAPGRYRWVDAYLAREALPLGAAKVFLRNDREHPWFKNGFTLMAVYKPGETGSGNDLTVSVTPGSGIDLRELWWRLEALENEAWNGQRPNDDPRLQIAGYPGGKTPDGLPSPNEPWYDEQGRYTLIAAPRRLPSGEPGSRLGWERVQEAVWQTYQPFQGLLVRIAHTAEQRVALERCPAVASSHAGCASHQLKLAHWELPAASSDELQPQLRFTPTLKRYLAACIPARGDTPIRLADLPDADSYEFLELPGGFAVVSADGAYAIDDWHRAALPIEEIEHEFNSACIRLHEADRAMDEMNALQDDIDRFLYGKSRGMRPIDLLNRLTVIRQGLGRVSTNTLPRSHEPGVLLLREALERRWGLPGRIEALAGAADQANALLGNYLEYRTSSRINLLTLYGFPLAVAVGFFGFVFQELPRCFGSGFAGWDKVHWPGLLLFLVIVAFGMALIRLLSGLQDRRDRPHPGQSSPADRDAEP